jgi:hypothetical protein
MHLAIIAAGTFEFAVAEDEASVDCVMVRASLRSDHQWELSLVQQLCDSHGWVAFDGQTNKFTWPNPPHSK